MIQYPITFANRVEYIEWGYHMFEAHNQFRCVSLYIGMSANDKMNEKLEPVRENTGTRVRRI